jgi:hypothetical protein
LKVVKYITHKDINKQAWDNCLNNAANQMIYAYSWYLDVVSPNWDALVLGNYEAVMPLTQRKRFTISYLAQPFFTQQLGVFYANMDYMHTTNDFINAIPNKFKLIEINLNTYNIPSGSSFSIKQNITCHLDLNDDYHKIKSNYAAQINRNIKKSEKFNLAIDHQISSHKIIELFKLNQGKKIRNFKNKTYSLFLKLLDVLNQRKLLYYIGIKNTQGEYIAGAIFIKHFENAIFLFSGSNMEAKESGAMSLLIDSFIKSHANTQLILDFEGSNNKSLARFYLGFGSKEVKYFSLRKNNLPKIIRWVKG